MWKERTVRTGLVVLAGALAWARPAAGQETSEFQRFLEEVGGYDGGDLQDLASGKVMVRTLSRADDQEIAVLAVVSTTMTPEDFLNVARMTADAVVDESIVSVGHFGDPPTRADLAGLKLPDEIVSELSKCRPGDCKVKVTADLLGRIRALDPEVADYALRVDSILKLTLLHYVKEYERRGNEALLIFGDKPEPQAVRDALAGLFAESPYLYQRFPELHDYLKSYPAGNEGRFEDLLFWEVQNLGLRPVVELEHRTLFSPRDREVRAMAATTRIYSTHYFLAALEIGALVEPSPSARIQGPHLVYVARFRFDDRVTGLRRREVRGKLEGIVRQRIQAVKAAAEQGG